MDKNEIGDDVKEWSVPDFLAVHFLYRGIFVEMWKKFRGKQIFHGDRFAQNFHGKCRRNSAENRFSAEITLRGIFMENV
jgi:hypothetical protein